MEIANPLVEFFEGIVGWLGLSEGAASILSEMYLEKYSSNRFLGTEEIADRSGYSRTNVNLIMSQLEKLGIIGSERDLSKTGRGRKRMVYSVIRDIDDLVEIGLERARKQLEFLTGIIDSFVLENPEHSLSSPMTKTKDKIHAFFKNIDR